MHKRFFIRRHIGEHRLINTFAEAMESWGSGIERTMSTEILHQKAQQSVGSVDDLSMYRSDIGSVGMDELDADGEALRKRKGHIEARTRFDGLSERERTKMEDLEARGVFMYRTDTPYAPGLPPIRLFNIDAAGCERAIAVLSRQILNIREATSADGFVPPPKHKYESGQVYAQRVRIAEADWAESLRYNQKRSNLDAKELLTIQRVLQEALKSMDAMTSAKEAINAGDATALHSIEDDEIRNNLPQYLQLAKRAAVLSPENVLPGLENKVNLNDYMQVVQETIEENPDAIVHVFTPTFLTTQGNKSVDVTLPSSIGAGRDKQPPITITDFYRTRAVDAASRSALAFRNAATNYETFWKDYPEDYKNMAAAAIKNDPKLFFERDLWDKENIPKASTVIDMIDSFDKPTLLGVIAHLNPGNIQAVRDYGYKDSAGFIALIEKALMDQPTKPVPFLTSLTNEEVTQRQVQRKVSIDGPTEQEQKVYDLEALIVVSNNRYLIEAVQEKQPLYVDIQAALKSVNPHERRKILNDVDALANDEDLIISQITDILEQVEDEDNSLEKQRILQNNYQYIERIPRHVLLTGKYKGESIKDKLIQIFSYSDGLRHAPSEWFADEQTVRGLLETNATVYAYMAPEFKSIYSDGSNAHLVLELLLMAIDADANGVGNMHWKDVPDSTKRYLEGKGVTGIADRKRLADLVLTGEVQEDELTAETVKSPFDNKVLIQRLNNLRESGEKNIYIDSIRNVLTDNKGKPENLLDVSVDIITDSREYYLLVNNVMKENPYFFKYADQARLANKPSYKEMVKTAVAADPSLIKYAHENIQNNFSFLLELADGNERTLAKLIDGLKADVRLNSSFLTELMNSKMFDGDTSKLIDFLETDVLTEEVKGLTLLELVPLNELTEEKRNTFVREYMKKHPAAISAMEVIPTALQTNQEFIDMLLFNNPLQFEGIDHEHWYKNSTDTYKRWFKDAHAENAGMQEFLVDELANDVEFFKEVADGDFYTLTSLMKKVPPRLKTDEFIQDVHAALEDYEDEMLALYRGYTLSEAIFAFMESNVFTGDDTIRSVMQFWPKKDQTDRVKVMGYLKESNDPKLFATVHNTLRNNTDFIDMVMQEPEYSLRAIFPYLDHEVLYNKEREYYKTLVGQILSSSRTDHLYRYAAKDLQGDAGFIWERSGKRLTTFARLVGRMNPRKRAEKTFLKQAISLMKEESPRDAINFLKDYILPDPEYAAPITITNLLLDENGKLLKELMEVDYAIFTSNEIPGDRLTGDLLKELILIALPNEEGPLAVRLMLLKAPTASREQFIAEHPRIILDLFREESDKLVDFIGEENLTVELIGHMFTYYDTWQSTNVLMQILRVKPGVVEGLLRARPDLYMDANVYQQRQFREVLGNDVIDTLIDQYAKREENEKLALRRDALGKLQRSRQTLISLLQIIPEKEHNTIQFIDTNPAPNGKGTVDIIINPTSLKDAFDTFAKKPDAINSKTITMLATQYDRLIIEARRALKPEYIVDMSKDTFELQKEVQNELPDSAQSNVFEGINNTATAVQNDKLFILRYNILHSKLEPKQKLKALNVIHEQMEAKFFEYVGEMNNASRADKPYKARLVLWYLRSYQRVWPKDGPDGLTKQKLDSIANQAKQVLERAEGPDKPLDIFDQINEDDRAYYDLPNTQREFTKFFERLMGNTDKFALARGMNTLQAAETTARTAEIMRTVGTTERNFDLLRERFTAMGGLAAGEMNDAKLYKLELAAAVLDVDQAPKILGAIFNEIPQGTDPELVAKAIRNVALALPIRMSTVHNEVIQTEWKKVSDMLTNATN